MTSTFTSTGSGNQSRPAFEALLRAAFDGCEIGKSDLSRLRCRSYPFCSLEDLAVRTDGFSPIQHSTAGFDRLFDVAETAQRAGPDILGMGAAAVASNSALRELPGSRLLVIIDDVLEALSALDYHPKGPPGGKPHKWNRSRGLRVAT